MTERAQRPELDPAWLGRRLPEGFLLGTATAAYQVEGAVDVDGRTPSVWDTFCREPGVIADGSTGEVAADHYRRRADDVALLRRLGAPAHRFSVAWSRVQPGGRGPVNAAGLDHYDRFVDDLLGAGIRPVVTLLHRDLPQGLEDDGGWLNRATIDRFAEYAAIVGERLADRVGDWIPVDQPNVVTRLGYVVGVEAPGRRLGLDAIVVAHHLLVAHGRAAIALRAGGALSVGCATNHAPVWPASDDPADVGAAKLYDLLWNGHYLEGMLLGRYSPDLELLCEDVIRDGDLATMRQPLDFYGITYDHPLRVAAAPEDAPLPVEQRLVLGHPFTDADRPVVPEALREFLIMMRARFRAAVPPIVITGLSPAYATGPDATGRVDDASRIDYLAVHLRAVAEAAQRGVDVRGAYVPLLDGFEWADGLSQRTGLVHVDHASGVRTPKASFDFIAAVASAVAEPAAE